MKYNDCVGKLIKDKSLKFICKTVDDSLVRMTLDGDGFLTFTDVANKVKITVDPFPIWELEKEPVNFIEAINSEKEISSLVDEENGYLTVKDWFWELSNCHSSSQMREMINGKWFIK